MVKKKVKKSSNLLSLILPLVAVVLGVAAFCMMFLPCVEVVSKNGDLIKAFSGSNIAFGLSETETLIVSVTSKTLGFGFLALLGFVFPLLGGASLFFAKKNKIFTFVSMALFAVGALLIFLMTTWFASGLITENGEGFIAVGGIYKANELVLHRLGVGAIIGGILSILGACVGAAKLVLKK
ncbi:MAG: hypothetical protein RR086_06325 [Clostridia bacterium]